MVFNPITRSDVELIFKAITLIQSIEPCDEEVLTLTKKLEQLFNDIEEKNGVKKLQGLKYYSNGLIEGEGKDFYGRIIGTPWTSNSTVVASSKKKNHSFKYVKSRNNLLSVQLKDYIGKKVSTNKKIQLAKSLKALASISNNGIDAPFMTVFNHTNIFENLFDGIFNLLGVLNASSHQRFSKLIYNEEIVLPFFSQEQCKDILMIYDTIDPNQEYDKPDTGWHENELIKALSCYLCSCQFKKIPYDIKRFYTQFEDKRHDVILKSRTFEAYFGNKEEQELEYKKAQKELIRFSIDSLKELYNALYTIEDIDFRKLLLKLKIIEEGYNPYTTEQEEVEVINE